MTATVDAGGTLATWFRRSVERHPGATAIEVGASALTYGDLGTLVDRLASALTRAAGRRPRAVGLLAARSLAAYAGYLAALRAGATVVPLGPGLPPERNRRLCQVCAVDVVILDDAGADQAAELLAGVAAVPLRLTGGDAWRWSLAAAPDLPAPARGPDAVAYVLFTSGSTGEPKGVPIKHRQLAPYLAHCIARYGVGPGSRLSQTFDMTFDPSVFDLFVAWCAGATLVVPEPNEVLAPAGFVNGRGITHWFAVPSSVSIAQRLRALPAGVMPGLRWSLFAGEQLTLRQADAWARAAPGSAIVNLYGPTELTITCTGYRLPVDRSRWPSTSNGTVPIGRPYPHVEAAVLTQAGGEGDEGELCVRGPQRFDGYLHPDHDRGRFLRRDGGRAAPVLGRPRPEDWYRTGDRVRVEHGELVHLGRLDDQVKVRGHRVEPGEIESLLRARPGVRDTAVVAVTSSAGEVELHAFYTGDAGLEPELAEEVRQGLPPYMAPRRLRHVAAFPTGPNGKVDRRRLAQLAAEEDVLPVQRGAGLTSASEAPA